MNNPNCLHCRLMDAVEKWADDGGKFDEGGVADLDGDMLADCFARAFMELVLGAKPDERSDLYIKHIDALMRLGAQVGLAIIATDGGDKTKFH